MKYEIMKLFPGSWMEVGEQHSEDHISHLNPDSFPDVFKLVEYNFEGRIIKVGDKVGPMTITTIDAKNKCVFFENGEFVWMDKLPSYYSVVNWRIHTHAMPPIIETQFTCNDIKEAEEFVLYNYPCLTIDEVLHVAVDDPFDSYLSDELKKIVQKKLDANPA